jgi:hypothetical protein
MSIQKFRIDNGTKASQQAKPVLWGAVVSHVKKLNLSPELTEQVLYKAKTLSPGSWNHFLENINVHITNITRANKANKVKSDEQTE